MIIDSKYRMSPFLNIQPEETNADTIKVHNYLSGKSFELGIRAVEILRFFRKSRTSEEMQSSFDLNETLATGFLKSMVKSKLLISEAEEEEFVMQTTTPRQTIFGLPGLANYASGQKKVIFIGVPFAKGNDKSLGSENFPTHLRNKTNYLQLNTNSADQINFNCLGSTEDFANLKKYLKKGLLSDAGDIYFDFKETIDFDYEKMAYLAGKFFQTGGIPFFIGGDHSITYPLVKSAVDMYGEISMIHFDAHSDTSFSKYDLIRHGRKISHTHADVMTRCIELTGLKAIHQFGIRGLSNRFSFESPKQKIYWASELRHGSKPIILDKSDKYYVTVDIDVIDPSFAPGTGSHSTKGLTPEELIDTLYKVLSGLDIIGLDLVEVDPTKDVQDITTQVASEVILNLVNMLKI
jgi:agmatinase